MPTDDQKALVRYLLGASRAGLGDFYLRRLNRVANGEKAIRNTLHEVIENAAWVLLANLLRDYGEEIAEVLGSPRRRRPR